MAKLSKGDLYEALDSLRRAVLAVDDSWDENPGKAWIYGIVVGYGDEEWGGPEAEEDFWEEFAYRHNFKPLQVARLKRYRQAVFTFMQKMKEGTFDGRTFDQELDGRRLGKQLLSVKELMEDGQWRTLDEIGNTLGIPTHSASARLRDLRKPKFGGRATDILRRRRGDEKSGLHEYRYNPVREPKQMEWDL